MIIAVVALLLLLGATTWLAQTRTLAADPARHHRWTGAALLTCLITAASLLVLAAVNLRA